MKIDLTVSEVAVLLDAVRNYKPKIKLEAQYIHAMEQVNSKLKRVFCKPRRGRKA